MLVLSSGPVRLVGEFQFNLQSLKEIKFSNSFLGLDIDSRKCQNMETYNDCKTRLYMKNMTQVCGCLPLSHIMSKKVCYIIILKIPYVLIGNTVKRIFCALPRRRLNVARISPSTQRPARGYNIYGYLEPNF